MRLCRKTVCSSPAAATCSFHYPLKQVWIAPLTEDPQPGSYDLCSDHADRLVAPLGWDLTDIRERTSDASAERLGVPVPNEPPSAQEAEVLHSYSSARLAV
jgi:hypothetical protein